jgi:hypothetical protein
MPPSSISFLVDCPSCNKNVSATTVLGRADLIEALAAGADVRAIHMADVGDHQWSLTKEQKVNLRKRMAEGLV